jgi:hypothetical protein
VRCDRGIADEVAARFGDGRFGDFESAVRWIGLEIARAVRRTVDITAELGDAIVLAGDEAMWVPKHAVLHADACFKSGDRALVVMAYERVRSDRRPTVVVEPATVAEAQTREDVPVRLRSRESA